MSKYPIIVATAVPRSRKTAIAASSTRRTRWPRELSQNATFGKRPRLGTLTKKKFDSPDKFLGGLLLNFPFLGERTD